MTAICPTIHCLFELQYTLSVLGINCTLHCSIRIKLLSYMSLGKMCFGMTFILTTLQHPRLYFERKCALTRQFCQPGPGN